MMRIGIFLGLRDILPSLGEHLRRVEVAEEDGFDSFWFPQLFGVDVLTVIAMAGARTQRIEIGTAVVPTFPRHPVALAQQALTAQAATGVGSLLASACPTSPPSRTGWGYPTISRPATCGSIFRCCGLC